MTRASTVTWGQASAMMPTAMARMPRRTREALSDLNMTVFPFFCALPWTFKGTYHFVLTITKMIQHVKSREPAGDQREITGLPALAAVSRPFEGLAPRS